MAIGIVLAVGLVASMLFLLIEPCFKKTTCEEPSGCGKEFFSFFARKEVAYAFGTWQPIYESRYCPHCNRRLSQIALNPL